MLVDLEGGLGLERTVTRVASKREAWRSEFCRCDAVGMRGDEVR